MFLKIFSALFATIFIAILFQVRKENVLITAIGGGLGSLVNECMLALGCSAFVAVFIASIAIAFYSEIMARVRKATVPTFLISALFPLVPVRPACTILCCISYTTISMLRLVQASIR